MQPLPCPQCGNAMNRHAEKLVVASDAPPPPAGAAFAGVIEQQHLCPACGWIESVRVSP